MSNTYYAFDKTKQGIVLFYVAKESETTQSSKLRLDKLRTQLLLCFVIAFLFLSFLNIMFYVPMNISLKNHSYLSSMRE